MPPRRHRANSKQKVSKLSARFQASHGICNSVQRDIDEVTSALLVYHHNAAVAIKRAPRRALLSVNVPTPYLRADNMDGKALDRFPIGTKVEWDRKHKKPSVDDVYIENTLLQHAPQDNDTVQAILGRLTADPPHALVDLRVLPYFSSGPWEWLLQYDTVMEGLALLILYLSRAAAQYRQLNDALRSNSELRIAIAKAAHARSSLQAEHLHTSAALQHDILHRADPHRRELINAYDYFIPRRPNDPFNFNHHMVLDKDTDTETEGFGKDDARI